MRVPIHVLRAGLRRGVPRARPFTQRDGFHQMVPLVNGLAVRDSGQPVEESNAKPPSIGVGCMRVKGLGQPVRCDAKQQPSRQFIKPFVQPFFMNFKRVIGQVHPVRNDGIHHRVQMTVKHTAVEVQETKARFKQLVRGRRRHGREIRVLHRWRRKWPGQRPPFKRLNKAGCYLLKGLGRNARFALAQANPLPGGRFRCPIQCLNSG